MALWLLPLNLPLARRELEPLAWKEFVVCDSTWSSDHLWEWVENKLESRQCLQFPCCNSTDDPGEVRFFSSLFLPHPRFGSSFCYFLGLVLLSETLEKALCPCLFSNILGNSHSWPHSPFFHFQSQQFGISLTLLPQLHLPLTTAWKSFLLLRFVWLGRAHLASPG